MRETKSQWSNKTTFLTPIPVVFSQIILGKQHLGVSTEKQHTSIKYHQPLA
jgi:hypothetical protein